MNEMQNNEQMGYIPQQNSETSTQAILSMVLSIVGIPLSSVFIGYFLVIAGIVLGHISLTKIDASRGQITGKGFAIAGFVIGYVFIAINIIVLLVIAGLAIFSIGALR